MDSGSVRAHVFGQHDELGRLLHLTKVVVEAAARGDSGCQAELPRVFELLAAKLERHLAFEEEHLLPLLLLSRRPADRMGAERLFADHIRQRESFRTLARQFHESPGSDPALVSAFLTLDQELRSDIAEEERWLLDQTPLDAVSSALH